MAKLTILAKIELPEGWTLAPYPGDPSGELFLVVDGKYHSPAVSWFRWDEIRQDPKGDLDMMIGRVDEGLTDTADNFFTEYQTILEED